MSIFKSRKSPGFWKKSREFLWPSMGWERTVYYFWHRIFRTGDSVYKITAGLACGTSVSWTPLLGTHLLQAFILSRLVKGNVFTGLLGTLIGNPWTFPFMFFIAYKLGICIFTALGITDMMHLTETTAFSLLIDDPSAFWDFLLSKPLGFFLPLLTGGYICAFLCWFITYGIMYYPVMILHNLYQKQRTRIEAIKAKARKQAGKQAKEPEQKQEQEQARKPSTKRTARTQQKDKNQP